MAQTSEARASWSGKWMFILAAAASAVGLGNMWRFPYLDAKYGGGTFIFVYLILVFTFGVTMLLLETSLGRKTGQSVIGAYSSFGAKYKFIGVLAAAVPFIITPYYCIIGGWVAKYCFSYFTGSGSEAADGGGYFSAFITSTDSSFLWMLVFMAICFIVVSLGVKGGIEKANLVMMPLLLAFAIGIAIFVATMPGAADGIAYYLTPDFSKLSPELFIGALGQMFYSLSLAMGIMVTYGSYLDKKENLPMSVSWIGCADLVVSMLAGMMIVPAAFMALGSAEAVAENSGPSLMFIILPGVFDQMGAAASVIGAIFFLLVLFAALTSAISLTEALVSIVADATNWSRRKSLIAVMLWVVVVGSFINAGYNGLSFLEPLGAGTTLLDFADFFSNSVLMPIVAFLTVVFVGWIVKPKVLIDEIRQSSPFKLEKAWVFMVKYVSPVLVAVIFVAYVGAQFGVFSF